jgi:hypothetical protein
MTENETPPLPPSMSPPDIGAGIAKHAENLDGLGVVSVERILALVPRMICRP